MTKDPLDTAADQRQPATSGVVLSASDLVNASRVYLAEQQTSGAVLSPSVSPTSPGVVLSRAFAGAARIQRI